MTKNEAYWRQFSLAFQRGLEMTPKDFRALYECTWDVLEEDCRRYPPGGAQMIIGKLERDDAQTYASHGNAILGIRDSGKSYTAMLIAERLHDAGIPWVAFDAIGKWQYMRSPGIGKGYPIVVVGGMHGDLPLTVESAPEIIRAAMHTGISVVIDLYDINLSKADWKRIVATCVRVLLFENKSLRHIFLEEAAEFVPQRPGPDQTVVYAEIEKLARMGGNQRLGYTLINQRAEEVSKAVLELCDSLFLHRQKGKNSLASLTKWLDVADVQGGSREIVKSLPTLPQGECWAWMSGTARPVHVKVPNKNSFEPDRRAMLNQEGVPAPKRVDASKFVGQMKSLLDDMRLESDKKIMPKVSGIDALQIDVAKVSREAYEAGVSDGKTGVCNSIVGDMQRLKTQIEEVLERYDNGTGVVTGQNRPIPVLPKTAPESTSKYLEVRSKKPARAKREPGAALESAALRLLAAFKRYSKGITFEQACTVAGFVPGNGYFYNGKRQLIEREDLLQPRADGDGRYLSESLEGKPMTRSELARTWAHLKRPAPEMLSYLLAMTRESIDANVLAQNINMKPGNGYWYHGLSQLKRAGIIEDSRGPVRLTEFVRDMKP